MLNYPEGTAAILVFWTADYMELWEHKVFLANTPRALIESKIKRFFKQNGVFTFVTVSYWDSNAKEIGSQNFWRRDFEK